MDGGNILLGGLFILFMFTACGIHREFVRLAKTMDRIASTLTQWEKHHG